MYVQQKVHKSEKKNLKNYTQVSVFVLKTKKISLTCRPQCSETYMNGDPISLCIEHIYIYTAFKMKY